MRTTARTHPGSGTQDTSRQPDRRQVVVGIEPSGHSAVVIEWAVREARARSAPLTLVHTWEWESIPVWSTPYHYGRKKDLEHESERILVRARQCALAAGAPDVRVITERGYAPDILVALTAQASLLVVGNRHASALARGVFGSVSTAVVSEAKCPVIVLSGEPGAAETHTRALTEVVVGVAGAPHDQGVLAFGFDFAREHSLALRAVFGWDPMFGNVTLPPPDVAKLQLAETVAGWRERYPEIEARAVVRRGAPVDVLVETSAAQALLVVGRHAPRLRLAAVLGSTTLGVVHHAACPVAVVPPEHSN